MAPWASRVTTEKPPVFYFLVDFRNYRRSFRPYKKPDFDDCLPDFARRSLRGPAAGEKRVVLIRARLLHKSCLPNKVKRSDPGWRRKGNNKKAQQPHSSASTTRPTILLPPITDATSSVVSARVQSDRQAQYIQCPPSEPSAPSPGQVFYNSEDHSDIAFIVGVEKWRFPAHSFILGKMEATLHALLETAGPDGGSAALSETANSGEEPSLRTPMILRLPEVQPDVFEQMLRFIYTRQVSLSSVDSTLRLLHPAEIYQLPDLKSQCLSYLSKHLTTSNVLPILSHLLKLCADHKTAEESLSHDSDNQQNELVFECFIVIDKNADVILQSEAFETLEYDIMTDIVKRDSLEVSSESIVFDAIMRWACRTCKKQRKELTPENKCVVLGKALFFVRYLLMSPEEFLRGPIAQGIFSKDDKEILLSRINSNASTTVPLPPHWSGWKIAEKRQRRNLSARVNSESDRLSGLTDVSPTLSVLNGQSVSPENMNKSTLDRKKKSMSKKLLDGVGDLVICVIQLLD